MHADAARTTLPYVLDALADEGVEIRGCSRTREVFPQAKPATEDDWYAEYLAPILAVRVVDDLDAAIAHIRTLRLEPHRGDRHERLRELAGVRAARRFVDASASTARPRSPTATGSASAPRSASRPRSCTPTVRWASKGSRRRSSCCSATDSCGPTEPTDWRSSGSTAAPSIPIHVGHLRAAEEVAEALDLDARALRAERDAAAQDGERRRRDRARRASDSPGCGSRSRATRASRRSAIEVERGGASYLVDTLRELRAQHAPDELVFLVGSDAFAEMGAWRAPAELFALAHYAVMLRPPLRAGTPRDVAAGGRARRLRDRARSAQRAPSTRRNLAAARRDRGIRRFRVGRARAPARRADPCAISFPRRSAKPCSRAAPSGAPEAGGPIERPTRKKQLDVLEKTRLVVDAALDVKAEDVVALDVRELSSFADVFVVATGRSDRQVRAIADSIEEADQEGRRRAARRRGLRRRPLGADRPRRRDRARLRARSARALRHRTAVERRRGDPDPEPAAGRGRAVSGPVMLVVLDGFGLGDGGPGDATAQAHAPFFARARADLPARAARDLGRLAVGLPPGQMGNSEVGHMTMGAGPHPLPGHDAHLEGLREGRTRERRRDRARARRRGARQAVACTCSASSRTAACTATRIT